MDQNFWVDKHASYKWRQSSLGWGNKTTKEALKYIVGYIKRKMLTSSAVKFQFQFRFNQWNEIKSGLVSGQSKTDGVTAVPVSEGRTGIKIANRIGQNKGIWRLKQLREEITAHKNGEKYGRRLKLIFHET